jgi:hypothetical protein
MGWLLATVTLVAVAIALWRYRQGDYTAAGVEDRPEDFAEDDSGDWDDDDPDRP